MFSAHPRGDCEREGRVALAAIEVTTAKPGWQELIDHSQPLDSTCNDTLVSMAEAAGVVTVATNNVQYAGPAVAAR